jgi:hypothetical protein
MATGQELIFHPDPRRNQTMIRSEKKASWLMFALSWIFVLIPLGWGVVQSVVKSLPLFQMPAVSKTISSSTEK